MLIEAARRAEAAASEMLELVGAGAASCSELREMLAVSRSAMAALSAAQVSAAAAVAGRERHGDGGAEVLAGSAGLSRREARSHLKTAEALREAPAARDAVESGRVSAANARRLAEASETAGASAVDGDGELLAKAVSMRPEQFAREARRWVVDRDGDDGESQHRRSRARRCVRVWDGDDGMVHLRGELDPVTGRRVANRLRSQAARMHSADKKAPADGTGRRNFGQCMADALDALTTTNTPTDKPHNNGSRNNDSGSRNNDTSGRAGGSRNNDTSGRAGGSRNNDSGSRNNDTSGRAGGSRNNDSGSRNNDSGRAGGSRNNDTSGRAGGSRNNDSGSRNNDSGRAGGSRNNDTSGRAGGSRNNDSGSRNNDSGRAGGSRNNDSGSRNNDTSGRAGGSRNNDSGSRNNDSGRAGGSRNNDTSGRAGGSRNNDSGSRNNDSGRAGGSRNNDSGSRNNDSGRAGGSRNNDTSGRADGPGNSRADGSGRSVGGGGRPIADICVVAHVDGATGRLVAELPDGTRLPRAVLEELSCNARLTGLVYDRDGKPIWRTHSVRTATESQRQILLARHGGCFHCAAHPALCQIHHIKPVAQGGSTKLDNMTPVCWDCHQKIHHHNWRIRKNPDGNHTLHPPEQTRHGPAHAPDPPPAPPPTSGHHRPAAGNRLFAVA